MSSKLFLFFVIKEMCALFLLRPSDVTEKLSKIVLHCLKSVCIIVLIITTSTYFNTSFYVPTHQDRMKFISQCNIMKLCIVNNTHSFKRWSQRLDVEEMKDEKRQRNQAATLSVDIRISRSELLKWKLNSWNKGFHEINS